MERRARLLFWRAGIPEPELNAIVTDSSGGWLAESDFVWRRYPVVAEFDGDHHRTDRRQWQRDVERQENLQDEGWVYLRLTADAVRPGPAADRTLARLRRHLTRCPT